MSSEEFPSGEVDVLDRCVSLMNFIIPSLRSRISHWKALLPAVNRAISFASKSSDDMAREIAEVLSNYSKDDSLACLEQVQSLLQAGRLLLDRTQTLPHSHIEGSLWLALHGSIEQHMEMAASGLSDLAESLETVAADLTHMTTRIEKHQIDSLAAAIECCRGKQMSLVHLTTLALTLDGIRMAMPDARDSRLTSWAAVCKSRCFQIAIIDDEKVWRDFVSMAVEVLRRTLGSSFIVETVCFDNVLDARNALLLTSKTVPSPRSVTPDRSNRQTIAVVDMGLPSDASHRERILAGNSTPDRNNGQSLLHDLRAFRTNIPCIVLTVPSNLLEDQLKACAQGVEDNLYILKAIDKLPRLVEALLQICARSQAHRVEITELPHYDARIDGVPISLADMPFRTLYALSRLSKQSHSTFYTPCHILDELASHFHGVYDYLSDPETTWERALVLASTRRGSWWRAAWNPNAANVMRLWAVSKSEANGKLDKAVTRFASAFPRPFAHAWKLLGHYRDAHRDTGPWGEDQHWPSDAEALGLGYELVFGGLDIDIQHDYDPDNIEKHMNEIRTAIHLAFQSAHLFIERNEIIRSGLTEEGAGYRIRGDIILDSDNEDLISQDDPEWEETAGVEGNQSRRDIRDLPITVLVVENEVIYSERIASLLKVAGFNVVTATNVEDAIRHALVHQPNILCLDLHIPASQKEYLERPDSGDERNGLEVLRLYRDLMHRQGETHFSTKVMIPTALYDQDELRERAALMNVPISNFVPKGIVVHGAPWEGHLLLTASRLRQEIRLRAILPALPPWRYPVIRILPGTDMDKGTVLLNVNGRDSSFRRKEGLLVAVLLRHRDTEVTYDEIDIAVWGEPKGANTRNQKINDVRQKIRKEWLSVLVTSPDRPELEVLENVKSGLVLHAYIEES